MIQYNGNLGYGCNCLFHHVNYICHWVQSSFGFHHIRACCRNLLPLCCNRDRLWLLGIFGMYLLRLCTILPYNIQYHRTDTVVATDVIRLNTHLDRFWLNCMNQNHIRTARSNFQTTRRNGNSRHMWCILWLRINQQRKWVEKKLRLSVKRINKLL